MQLVVASQVQFNRIDRNFASPRLAVARKLGEKISEMFGLAYPLATVRTEMAANRTFDWTMAAGARRSRELAAAVALRMIE